MDDQMNTNPEFTEDVLQEIERLAALFFSPKEIATVTGIDKTLFLRDLKIEDSQIFRAYYTGKLKSESELRESIVKLAKRGSSPAQSLLVKILDKVEIEEKL